MKFLKLNILHILFILIFSITLLLINSAIAENKKDNKKSVIIYLFWKEGCPYCEKEKEFLSSLKKKYPKLEIRDYEVLSNIASRELLMTMSKSYGINLSGVPVTFVGDKGIVGFDSDVANQIEDTIKTCLKKVCPDPLFYKK